MTTRRVTYAVRPMLVAAMVAGTVIAAAVAARIEAPERMLFLVAAIGAGTEAARALLLRPTLAADTEGIDLVVGLRRERHPWSAVTDVAPLAPPAAAARLRRRANALEVDLGDRLLVVPAYRLGAPIPDVVAALSKLGGNGGL